jgi:hypothetical protein
MGPTTRATVLQLPLVYNVLTVHLETWLIKMWHEYLHGRPTYVLLLRILRMFHKNKQELLTLPFTGTWVHHWFFWWVCIAHLFSFLCYVFLFCFIFVLCLVSLMFPMFLGCLHLSLCVFILCLVSLMLPTFLNCQFLDCPFCFLLHLFKFNIK